MRKLFVTFVLTISIIASIALSQSNGDQIALQKALQAPTDSAKIEQINAFITENPTSQMIPNAYAIKFQIYSNMKNDSGAYFSVKKYLSLLDPSQRVPAMNAVAFEFAQRKVFIDSAAVLIDSAIALYGKEEPVLLNTKALILFRQKKNTEALNVQQHTVSLLPPNSSTDPRYVSFFVQLGFIQFEGGDALNGMQKIVLGNIVLPKQSLANVMIDSMLIAKNVAASSASRVRDSLYRNAVSLFLRNSADSVMAKSVLGVALARMKMFPESAVAYSLDSYIATRERTIEERSGSAAALGLTYYHFGRYSDAEQYLVDAASFASPNETELFLSLGDVKEKLGKKKEAFDVYLAGAMGSRASSVYDKLIALKNELYPTISLDSLIVAYQAASLKFTPEEFHRTPTELKKNETERVVLAELFTGSECRPCQAADVAFDYLIERYRTSSLAILEYHLHIPAPDPFVNMDSENRGNYYGVNSTPTAVFGGTTVNSSGGSRVAARNKFLLYSDIIERQMKRPTTVTISVKAAMKKNIISVYADAVSGTPGKSLKLRIALVEDEVFYKGANGIDRHKFVVRKMLKSTDGFAFAKNGKVTVNQKVDLKAVQKELEAYYTKANTQFAEMGTAIKENKTKIDPARLAIVAFVQDDTTKEVLQAVTEKVSVKVNSK
ncbi:MAG: hypothetical protein ACOYNS_00265 [Bacteroidota bacterium]